MREGVGPTCMLVLLRRLVSTPDASISAFCTLVACRLVDLLGIGQGDSLVGCGNKHFTFTLLCWRAGLLSSCFKSQVASARRSLRRDLHGRRQQAFAAAGGAPCVTYQRPLAHFKRGPLLGRR